MRKTMVILMTALACLAAVAQEDLAETLKRIRPNVEADAMLAYYRTNAPDLLEEIEKRRKAYPEAMDAYLGQLADHFQEVDKLRGEDNALYDRMIRQEKYTGCTLAQKFYTEYKKLDTAEKMLRRTATATRPSSSS